MPPSTAHGSGKKRLYLLAVPVAGFMALGSIGAALSPYLLVRYPVLLIAMSPLVRHLVLVAPSIEAPAFFTIAILRMFAPDPFVYFLGHRYGPRAVVWMEQRFARTGRFIRALERLFMRAWFLAVFVSPGMMMCTLAGATRVPFAAFVAVNIAGTVAVVSLVRIVGGAFSDWILLVTRFVEENLVVLTVASVALAVAAWFVWGRRLRADAEGLREMGSGE